MLPDPLPKTAGCCDREGVSDEELAVVDVCALASPWTGFANLAFSTGSASIALPNDALLGVAAAGMITDNLYAIAGFGDANGDPRDPFQGFETFFEDHEYFKSFEIGWTDSQERLVSDNVHLTFWHIDQRAEAGTPSGWGVDLSASKLVGERWMPFLRAGWTKDGGSLLDRSVSAGLGYQAFEGRDQLGLAVNWGRPNKDGFGPGLDDQWTFEVFYRWQIPPGARRHAEPPADARPGAEPRRERDLDVRPPLRYAL